jgi:hypothetical protein
MALCLPQLHSKALYNSRGLQHGHIALFRSIGPAEFDAAAAARPAAVRRLMRAAGDERDGARLLADWRKDRQVRMHRRRAQHTPYTGARRAAIRLAMCSLPDPTSPSSGFLHPAKPATRPATHPRPRPTLCPPVIRPRARPGRPRRRLRQGTIRGLAATPAGRRKLSELAAAVRREFAPAAMLAWHMASEEETAAAAAGEFSTSQPPGLVRCLLRLRKASAAAAAAIAAAAEGLPELG